MTGHFFKFSILF